MRFTHSSIFVNACLGFFGGFAPHALTTGAVWPGSKTLSRLVADSCEVASGAMVIELGASRKFHRPLLQRCDGLEIMPILWRNLPPAIVFPCRKRNSELSKRCSGHA